MRLGDVVERHHDDAQEQHRRNGPDPVPVRRQDSVLIRRRGPTHQLQRAEIGGQKAQARHPRGHLAPGQEKLLAGFGTAFQIETDRQDETEINDDDDQIDGIEGYEPRRHRQQL
jgi:hypothetical protein